MKGTPTLKGHHIVCVASASWDAMWVNPQHLMSRLARHNRVLYLNNMGLRPPSASKSDLGKIFRRLGQWFAPAKQEVPGCYVLSPVSIPFHRFRLIRKLNAWLLRRQVRTWMKKLGMHRPILWSYLPTGKDLIGQLNEKLTIYHCVDEYAENPNVPAKRIRKMEKEILEKADLTFVTNPTLYESKKDLAREIHYFPNTADVAHFRDYTGPKPILLEKIRAVAPKSKIIGYQGNISDYKIDIPLLEKLADKFPQHHFVLVGPVGWGDPDTKAGRLIRRQNVHHMEQVNFRDLPGYVQGFDVCLIPQNLNDSTKGSFPMKFYEYLACKKPVVATDLPAFDIYKDRPDFVRLANNHEEFIQALIDAMDEEPDSKVLNERLVEAEKNDWEVRTEQISEKVIIALDKPRKPKKVALVHDWLTGMRGGEKVLEALCELYPDADLYTLLYLKGKLSPIIENRKITSTFVQRLPKVEKLYRNYLPLFPLAARQIKLDGYDLVVSTSHCVVKSVRTMPSACHISYIHTPMRYVWELFDEYFGKGKIHPVKRLAGLVVRPFLQRWDAGTSNRVDIYLANSEHVRKRIQEHYKRDATVIHPPVNIRQFSIADKPDDFYLIVSAFAPYKRIDLALEAFTRLGKTLKVVGTGQDLDKLRKTTASNIEFLGWQSDEAVADLYRRCRAFIFPGEEDFGITPLEAMASGRPVIAYAKGGALETVIGAYQGEPAPTPICTGVFFKKQTVDALCEAIEYFEEQNPVSDPKLVRDHALTFDRENFKTRMQEFIDQAFDQFTRSRD